METRLVFCVEMGRKWVDAVVTTALALVLRRLSQGLAHASLALAKRFQKSQENEWTVPPDSELFF